MADDQTIDNARMALARPAPDRCDGT